MKRFLLSILFVWTLTSVSLWADTKTALQQLQQSLLWVDYFYVDTVNTDKLAETAIRAMLEELDPHSSYLTAEEVKSMNEGLGGNFEGIGVRYQMQEDTLYIINTVTGGPSEKVGIMAGDRIIMVDDTLIAGVKMSNKEIQRRLRGPKGTKVNVGIKRDGEPELIHFNITRDKIPVYSVDASYMPAPKVGYIKISRFAQTTPQEVAEAMAKLTKQGIESLIIDLQNNGGGYLNSAVELANFFLPNNQVVVYTQGRADRRREYKTGGGKKFEGKLVVLIDEESASASEILSGAIQDLDRGIVVGRRSFGKGLVQRPIELPGGSMIRLTVSHYHTPSGRCIQKPYTKGDKDNYNKDLSNRYESGELLSADSIHFADSLQYKTSNGRIVYGGGGIMPDIFVPLDTTKIAKTHRDLIAKGTYGRYIIEYFSKNQKTLKKKYKDFDAFNQGFETTDQMIAELCERGRADSVKVDTTELNKSLDLLKLQLKANIASDLFESNAFSQIMNEQNNIFRRGLQVICDDKLYQDIISGKKTEQTAEP